MKKCNDCQIVKDDSEFNIKRYKNGSVGLRAYCKPCSKLARDRWRASSPKDNERNKAYNKANSLKIRGNKLKKYWPGLTWQEALEQYNIILTAQGGHCAICPITHGLHVDHCHTTLAVRGILCNGHNRALGFFKDDPAMFYKAIDYLSKNIPIDANLKLV